MPIRSHDSPSPNLRHWHGRLALFCYYGFAQMTMRGYADITAFPAPATTLSQFVALFGMF